MIVDVCLSPQLYTHYHRANSIVVVVDIFRASSTIVSAFEQGVAAIRPVASIQEAESYKAKGWLIGAERNVRRCSFADFGNSPNEYTADKVGNQKVVFTTTNGTKALHMATEADQIVIGAFTNIQAVADYCLKQQKDVVVLCSGWEDKVNVEDSLFAGALASILIKNGYTSAGDSTLIATTLWSNAATDLSGFIEKTEHIKRLKNNNLQKDAAYCLTLNLSNKVPFYSKKDNLLTV